MLCADGRRAVHHSIGHWLKNFNAFCEKPAVFRMRRYAVQWYRVRNPRLQSAFKYILGSNRMANMLLECEGALTHDNILRAMSEHIYYDPEAHIAIFALDEKYDDVVCALRIAPMLDAWVGTDVIPCLGISMAEQSAWLIGEGISGADQLFYESLGCSKDARSALARDMLQLANELLSLVWIWDVSEYDALEVFMRLLNLDVDIRDIWDIDKLPRYTSNALVIDGHVTMRDDRRIIYSIKRHELYLRPVHYIALRDALTKKIKSRPILLKAPKSIEEVCNV